MAGPLTDVRVLELGRVVPVPLCGQVLTDLGADVVEAPRASGVV